MHPRQSQARVRDALHYIDSGRAQSHGSQYGGHVLQSRIAPSRSVLSRVAEGMANTFSHWTLYPAREGRTPGKTIDGRIATPGC